MVAEGAQQPPARAARGGLRERRAAAPARAKAGRLRARARAGGDPEAMEKALARSEWDVVVSDYRLPRFGAPEALELFRASGLAAPFVVVSGKLGEEAAVEVMKAGADDFLDQGQPRAPERDGGAGARRGRGAPARRRGAAPQGRHPRGRAGTPRSTSSATPTGRGMEEALGWLGRATETSRVYVFENHVGEDGELWNLQLHKWVAPGVPPGVPKTGRQPHRGLPVPGRRVRRLDRLRPLGGGPRARESRCTATQGLPGARAAVSRREAWDLVHDHRPHLRRGTSGGALSASTTA